MSENKQSRATLFLVYSFLILLVTYVLSLGPAVTLCIDSNGTIKNKSVDFVESFYAPVFSVINKSALLTDLMQRYVNFCNRFAF